MRQTPIEVVIRDPKVTASDLAVKLVAGAALLALKAWIVLLCLPPVMAVFGVEASPNYGEAILMVLLVAYVLPALKNPTLGAADTNRYLTGGK